MKRENNHGEGGHTCPLFLQRKNNRERKLWKKRKKRHRRNQSRRRGWEWKYLTIRLLLVVIFIFSVVGLLGYGFVYLWQNTSIRNTQKELKDIRGEVNMSAQYAMQYDENGLPIAGIAAFLADIYKDLSTEKECYKAPNILPKYKELYEINSDLIGWLSIDDRIL